jgi:hypothetical protein
VTAGTTSTGITGIQGPTVDCGAVLRLRTAGVARTLPDLAGQPVRAWEARGQAMRWRYDALRRPTHLFVRQPDAADRLVERTVYGEAHPDAAARNLRGQVHGHRPSVLAREDRHRAQWAWCSPTIAATAGWRSRARA